MQRCRAISARGATPVIVGGTNLYIQAFLGGFFDGPPPDPALRDALAALSPAELHQRLTSVDPGAAERIHPNDRRRLTRAIEVEAATGRPISAQQGQWAAPSTRPGVALIGLEWPVEMINARINDRVRAMVAEGLIEEVQRLGIVRTTRRTGPRSPWLQTRF